MLSNFRVVSRPLSTLIRQRCLHRGPTIIRATYMVPPRDCRVALRLTFQVCGFQTTSRRDVPPILAIILRPLLRVGAFFIGRTLRKWWAKKAASEKGSYIRWMREKKNMLLGIFGTIVTAIAAFYVTHVEEAPITKRSRFIMFTKSQQAELAKITFQTHLENHKDRTLPASHPIYKQLLSVTNRILNANQDLAVVKEKTWTLTVVDEPIKNAYVLPGGHIFVFMDALKLVENEDQLSIVIAHEMAHALLEHSVEQLSNGFVVDLLIALPLLVIWAMFPDMIAIFLQVIGYQLLSVIHELPYSRALETEADEVGLALAAKACIDVREAPVFWGLMRVLSEINDEMEPVPWLSTHPDHGDREQNLNSLIPATMELRNRGQCPRLPNADPRKRFAARSEKEHEVRFRQRGVW